MATRPAGTAPTTIRTQAVERERAQAESPQAQAQAQASVLAHPPSRTQTQAQAQAQTVLDAVRASTCRPASLAAELRVSLMRTARRLRAEKADQDLSDAQYSVLAFLDRFGPLTPRELADVERVRPPSMTRTIAALADLRLVSRTDHPDDGRQVLIALTEDGSATVIQTRRRRDAWLARRLAALDPGEREVLAAASTILRRIADA